MRASPKCLKIREPLLAAAGGLQVSRVSVTAARIFILGVGIAIRFPDLILASSGKGASTPHYSMSDLDEPATVFWTPDPHIGMLSITKKHFGTLRTALKFVMEESDPHKRNRVQIVTNGGKFLAFGDIVKQYKVAAT